MREKNCVSYARTAFPSCISWLGEDDDAIVVPLSVGFISLTGSIQNTRLYGSRFTAIDLTLYHWY
jgi:hypothetical protein